MDGGSSWAVYQYYQYLSLADTGWDYSRGRQQQKKDYNSFPKSDAAWHSFEIKKWTIYIQKSYGTNADDRGERI